MAELSCEFTRESLGHAMEAFEELDLTLADGTVEMFFDLDDTRFYKRVLFDFRNLLDSIAAIRSWHAPSNRRECDCWEGLSRSYPRVPWHAVVGMRNRTAHDWYEIERETVWDTIRFNLPDIRSAIEAELRK